MRCSQAFRILAFAIRSSIATLSFQIALATESLRLTSVEFVQSMQDASNSVPLISSKRTFVRVFFDYFGDRALAPIHGTLEMRRSSESGTKTIDNLTTLAPSLDPGLNGQLGSLRKR